MISLYDDDDRAYMDWLCAYPDGFVITMRRNKSPDYMVLHKANCRLISTYNKMAKRGGFTERIYIKGCAHTLAAAHAWVASNGRPDCSFSKVCHICKPLDTVNVHVSQDYHEILQEEVKESRLLTREERQRRLAEAPKLPTLIQRTWGIFKRNADVVVEVLDRAGGRCEGCGGLAPFYRASDNSPYLEVHHKLPLAENGEDTVENAIALCPNCHRKEHYGVDIPV
jgi:5-methylcytosine-specific restriction endonuclease McrA